MKVLDTRRWAQSTTAAVVVASGVQFTLWVRAHLAGQWPGVSRPPGVEAFLPIDGMLATRHLLLTGAIDAIHPACLAIFLGTSVERHSLRVAAGASVDGHVTHSTLRLCGFAISSVLSMTHRGAGRSQPYRRCLYPAFQCRSRPAVARW